jgi:hypothetical protein
MGKMRCHCDHLFSDVGMPAPDAGDLLRADDLAALRPMAAEFLDYLGHHRLDEGQSWVERSLGKDYGALYFESGDEQAAHRYVADDLVTLHLGHRLLEVWSCPDCGMLWIERDPERRRGFTFAGFEAEAGAPFLLLGPGMHPPLAADATPLAQRPPPCDCSPEAEALPHRTAWLLTDQERQFPLEDILTTEMLELACGGPEAWATARTAPEEAPESLSSQLVGKISAHLPKDALAMVSCPLCRGVRVQSDLGKDRWLCYRPREQDGPDVLQSFRPLRYDAPWR